MKKRKDGYMTLSEWEAADPHYYHRIAHAFARCSSGELHQKSIHRICRFCFDGAIVLAIWPVLEAHRRVTSSMATSRAALEAKRGKETPGQIFINCSASREHGHSRSHQLCCETCFVAAIASARFFYPYDLITQHQRSKAGAWVPEFELEGFDPRRQPRIRGAWATSKTPRAAVVNQIEKRLADFCERFTVKTVDNSTTAITL